MMCRSWMLLAAGIGCAEAFAAPRTWCNPLSLPDLPMGYLCRDNRNGDPFPPGTSWRRRFWETNTAGLTDIRQFREVADPAVLVEGNTWYLYPSCGLMWSSIDCGGTWTHIPVQEKGWYAPAIAKCRGKYYLVETGGQPLKVSDSPTGPFRELGKFKWETFGKDPQMPPPQDPALMADGDRLYLYWGCCSYPKAVWGAELDPDDPTQCKGEAKCLVTWDPKTYPFHDELIEGVWAFRRDDTYYVVYSTYLIVGHNYCMNAVKGASPLGPFEHQRKNPFLQTPQGIVTGTGHGSVWKDASGDFWANYCVEVNAYNGCERLIGQDRLDFDANGDIVCRTASETPQWLPSSGRKGDTGWKALLTDTAMVNAADRSLQTWWTVPDLPSTAEFRFREPSTIESARIIWREIGLDTLRGVKPGPIRYRIERRTDGRWFPWIDRSANDTDLLVDYREGEECTADAVRLIVLGAPAGITPAVAEFTVFGREGVGEGVGVGEPPPAPPIEKWGFRKEIADGIDSSGITSVPKDAKPWLENRISRCFFGPIKRPPFNRDELMDDIDYYPEAYLAQLRDEGVNGLWLTVEFRDLVETSFNHRHPTAVKRLAKLRRTVETCAKYGIGVWIFAIEPRCGNAAPEFYAANTNLFARAYWPPCDDWDHLMCPSKPESRRYLKEALKDLFTQVPGLKGFMNITHGERWTTCLSTFRSSECSEPCPNLCADCSKRQAWEVMNDILVPMRDGIREANPDAQFICWFYMAEMCAERSEWVYDCARHFPKGVSLQMNFESGIVRDQLGKPRVGGDYWLSQPGPSDIFRRISDVCREAGTRLSAKIQVSTSHEMATVPYVPVPGLLYRKFKAMRECGVRDAMYCWYFGCNPGLMNRAAGMLACEDFTDGEDAFLGRLAAQDWGEDAPRIAKLWKRFSDAYSNYPLANMVQYFGPFHDGVVWELHPDLDLKPLSRSWIRDRADGDTIGECLEEFELDDACTLAERMCAELEGTEDLDALAAKYADDVRRSRELGVMKAFRILCRSGRDILRFYRARRDAVTASRVKLDNAAARRYVDEMRRLAEAAKAYSAEMIPLCEKDSRLGFHSEAETYKFHPDLLRWRIGQLDRAIARIDQIKKTISGFECAFYPESEFERYAPVYRAKRDASGGIVIEGEASTNDTRDIEICLYDRTGSSYPSTFTAKPANGRFRTVVPAGDWGWIRIARPGMLPVPAVNDPVPLRLKLHHCAVRNCARLVVIEPNETAMAAGVSSAFADDDVWAGRTSHPAVVNPAVPVTDGSVLSLRGEWEFAACPNIKCAHMLGFQEATNFLGNAGVWAKSRTIGVPGCWDAQGVGEEGFGVGHDGRSNVTVRLRARHLGIGFYRRTVTVPDGWRGKRIWLKVGRINTAGWIWIDGEPVAQMTDAYRARKWDVTDLVRPGRPFEVMVEANNTYPYRNGQMLSYHRWGGIVRDIELEATPSCFIDDVWVRGNFDGRCAEAKVEVEGEQRNGSHFLRVTVEGETKDVGLRSTPTPTPSTYTLEIPLGNFRPWSPEHPNLYTAKVELVSADGRVMQTRFERFGVRKLEVKGEQFYLNDRPFYVRGFGDDSTYPITGFSPASKDFHLAHLKVARAAGFNYVRTHTHCELPEYFEAADEAGILIQPELHYGGDRSIEETFDYDPLGDAKAVTEACRRYVSYATLSGGNEGLHGPAAGRALYDWVKRNDPGRLVLEQDGGTFYNCHSPETSDYASGPMYMWERGTFNPRAFVCHEYANLAVKADARMEGDYTGAWLPRLTREMRRKNLAPSGLGEAWGDRLQDAQHDLQRFWARRSVECARKDPFCDGFIYWTIADYMHWDGTANTTTAQGLFDPFWRAKPHGTTPEAFAAVNGPTVILLDTENRTRAFGHVPPAAAPGKRFRAIRSDYPSHLCCDATSRLVLDETNRVYAAGERIPAEFIVSHYGEADLTDAKLVWTLAAEGRTLATAEHPLGTLFSGPAHTVAKDFITVPPVAKPVKATLTATLSSNSKPQNLKPSNTWIFWLFPRSVPSADPANVAIVEYGTDAVAAARRQGKNLLIVGNRKGKRDIFLGWWALHWRCVPRSPDETQNGVAIVPHDVLGDFPYEPFLSPLLFGIIGQGTPLPVAGFEEKDFVMVGEGNYDFKLYLAAKTRPDGGREAFVSGLDLEAPSVESVTLRRNVLAWLTRGRGAAEAVRNL